MTYLFRLRFRLADIYFRKSLDAILSRAVVHCPQEKWLAGELEVAERSAIANPESGLQLSKSRPKMASSVLRENY